MNDDMKATPTNYDLKLSEELRRLFREKGLDEAHIEKKAERLEHERYMFLCEMRKADDNLEVKNRTICYLADKLATAEERLQQLEDERVYRCVN